MKPFDDLKVDEITTEHDFGALRKFFPRKRRQQKRSKSDTPFCPNPPKNQSMRDSNQPLF